MHGCGRIERGSRGDLSGSWERELAVAFPGSRGLFCPKYTLPSCSALVKLLCNYMDCVDSTQELNTCCMVSTTCETHPITIESKHNILFKLMLFSQLVQ